VRGGKRCYGCANERLGGRLVGTYRYAPEVEACPRCGGRAFFYGPRMRRIPWAELSDVGPDTITPDGQEIPDAWKGQV
jgi:hypothetical protein